MPFAVYRLSLSHPSESLLSAEHGLWLGNDGPEFVLKPDELMIELLDRSIDGTVHNRTHLFRYNFADGAKRLEPMAFQPQDFAEEWLTRPWSEMQSKSAPETQKSHAKLYADFILGEYSEVVLCNAKPDRWSIGIEIRSIGEKELKEPIEAYLLVRDLGNYRFEMEAVSERMPRRGLSQRQAPLAFRRTVEGASISRRSLPALLLKYESLAPCSPARLALRPVAAGF